MSTNTTSVNATRLLTRQEAADLLGIRPQTLAKWATTKSHSLPIVRIGGAVRYRLEDLEKFIADNTQY
ncbi:helix-turn-helix domain-containing protein [Bremerella sp. T1]|uniref:helix-turn-helix domain-containing protein n=1 Tax=Bremerella sp. TYQ1 TaxID=3119568 RepID=UPI001CCC3D0A|nr:helix-turn-helix domain-containing protein [Bremerella volcania]UBM38365.1 helix-turn-helix domain-containing protein [Bremerella volcania]